MPSLRELAEVPRKRSLAELAGANGEGAPTPEPRPPGPSLSELAGRWLAEDVGATDRVIRRAEERDIPFERAENLEFLDAMGHVASARFVPSFSVADPQDLGPSAIPNDELRNPKFDFGGWGDEVNNALARGGLRSAASVPGTVAALLQLGKKMAATSHYSMVAESVIGKQRDEDVRRLQGLAREIYREAGMESLKAQKGGVGGYIVNVTAETLPMMAASTVASVAAGGAGAVVVGGMIEGEAAYQEAIGAGASEGVAQTERLVVGTINGLIERMQADAILRIGAGSKETIKGMADAVRARAYKSLAGQVGKAGLKQVANAVNEGFEETLQELVSMGVATVGHDGVFEVERLPEAFVGGFTAGGLLGLASSGVQSVLPGETVQEPSEGVKVTEGVKGPGSALYVFPNAEEASAFAEVTAAAAEESGEDVEIEVKGNGVTLVVPRLAEQERQVQDAGRVEGRDGGEGQPGDAVAGEQGRAGKGGEDAGGTGSVGTTGQVAGGGVVADRAGGEGVAGEGGATGVASSGQLTIDSGADAVAQGPITAEVLQELFDERVGKSENRMTKSEGADAGGGVSGEGSVQAAGPRTAADLEIDLRVVAREIEGIKEKPAKFAKSMMQLIRARAEAAGESLDAYVGRRFAGIRRSESEVVDRRALRQDTGGVNQPQGSGPEQNRPDDLGPEGTIPLIETPSGLVVNVGRNSYVGFRKNIINGTPQFWDGIDPDRLNAPFGDRYSVDWYDRLAGTTVFEALLDDFAKRHPEVDISYPREIHDSAKIQKQLISTALKEGIPVYIRFGKLPEGGRSRNYRDNVLESGVSVYEARKMPDSSYIAFLSGVDQVSASLITTRDDIYEVEGSESGRGADGEPVLLDAKSRKIANPRVRFVVFDHRRFNQSAPDESGGGLLRQGDRGAVEFAEDGKAIIHAFEAADLSTLLHEIGHVFRRDVSGEDLATLEKWAGVKDGNWTREAEELFARGFERYLREGKAPVPELKRLFWRFREWLRRVYQTIRNSPIDVKLTAEVRGVMDSLFKTSGQLTIDNGADASAEGPLLSGRPVRPGTRELGAVRKAITEYPPYQDALAETMERAQVLGLGPFYVDPVNQTDVEEVIGEAKGFKNKLQKMFVFEREESGSVPWDVAAENAGLEIADPYQFAELVRDLLRAQRGDTVVLEGVVDQLRLTGDAYFEALVTKYDMLRQGEASAQEINRQLQEVASYYGVEGADLEPLYVADSGIPMEVGGPTAAERQAMVKQIRELGKAQGVTFSKEQMDRAVEHAFTRAQEKGRKVGFKTGEVVERKRLDKIRDDHARKVSMLEDRIAEVRAIASERAGEFREAARAKEKERKDAQAKLLRYVQTMLPLRERGKMLARIKNVKDEKSLLKAMELADAAAEAHNVRTLRQQIADELARSGPREQSGKPKGKFTPETHDLLDQIALDIEKFKFEDREGVRQEIGKLIEAAENTETPSDVQQEAAYDQVEGLKYRGFNQMTSQELQDLLEDIRHIRKHGMTQARLLLLQWQERQETIRGRLVEIISSGKGLKPGSSTAESKQFEKDFPLTGFFMGLRNWANLMDILDRNEEGRKPLEGYAAGMFRDLAWTATGVEAKGRDQFETEIFEAAKKIFGAQWEKSLDRLNDKVAMGPFTNGIGETVEFREYTRDGVIKKFMEMMDPTLEATFVGGISEDGTKQWGMHWTPEIMQAFRDVLTAEEKAWAFWQLDFYRRYYESVNEVYRRVYGVSLPFNQWYSPLAREIVGGKQPEQMDMFKERMSFATPTSGALKTRVQSVRKLREIGATSTLLTHVRDMEHFKAWAEPMRELRGVFRDDEVTAAIRQYGSRQLMREIHYHIDTFARGRTARDQQVAWMDSVRTKITGALLGFRPTVLFKQPLSIINYMDRYGADFFSGVADYLDSSQMTPRQKIAWMQANSAILKKRWAGDFERDIQDHLHRSEDLVGKVRGKMSLFKTIQYFGIHQFDKGTTVVGTWAGFQHYKKQGLSDEQALAKAVADTGETQSSGEVVSLSRFQTKSSWTKLLTTFQNEPIKYLNMIDMAVRNWRAKRGSRIANARTILVAGWVAPILFQWFTDVWRWDKERQWPFLVLGPLNYVPVLGPWFADVVTSIIGGKTYDPGTGSVVVDVLREKVREVTGVARDIGDAARGESEFTAEEFAEAVELIVEAAGLATGVGTPYLVQVEKALREGDPVGVVFSKYARGEEKTERSRGAQPRK